MKRLLATLNVYVDLEDTKTPCSVGPRGEKEYELVMRPNYADENAVESASIEGFRTALAHELGHFLSMATKEKTHNSPEFYLGKQVGSPTLALESEATAWKYARKINPELSIQHEVACMNSYVSGSQREQEQIARQLANAKTDSEREFLQAVQLLLTKTVKKITS